MSHKNESLEQLIFEFLSRVEEATALLEKKFGTRCILGLWGANKIERCGVITGGITYELHGYGCEIYLPDACIDFDYGAGGRIDGFDAWWLYLYACEKPETLENITSQIIGGGVR